MILETVSSVSSSASQLAQRGALSLAYSLSRTAGAELRRVRQKAPLGVLHCAPLVALAVPHPSDALIGVCGPECTREGRREREAIFMNCSHAPSGPSLIKCAPSLIGDVLIGVSGAERITREGRREREVLLMNRSSAPSGHSLIGL